MGGVPAQLQSSDPKGSQVGPRNLPADSRRDGRRAAGGMGQGRDASSSSRRSSSSRAHVVSRGSIESNTARRSISRAFRSCWSRGSWWAMRLRSRCSLMTGRSMRARSPRRRWETRGAERARASRCSAWPAGSARNRKGARRRSFRAARRRWPASASSGDCDLGVGLWGEFSAWVVEPDSRAVVAAVPVGEGVVDGVPQDHLAVAEDLPERGADAGVPPVEPDGVWQVSVACPKVGA